MLGAFAGAWGIFPRLLPSTRRPSASLAIHTGTQWDILFPPTQAGTVFTRVLISFVNQPVGNTSSDTTESRIQVLKKLFWGGGGTHFLGCHDIRNGGSTGAGWGREVKCRRAEKSGGRKWRKRELRILEFYGKAEPSHELSAAGERRELGLAVTLNICSSCSLGNPS